MTEMFAPSFLCEMANRVIALSYKRGGADTSCCIVTLKAFLLVTCDDTMTTDSVTDSHAEIYDCRFASFFHHRVCGRKNAFLISQPNGSQKCRACIKAHAHIIPFTFTRLSDLWCLKACVAPVRCVCMESRVSSATRDCHRRPKGDYGKVAIQQAANLSCTKGKESGALLWQTLWTSSHTPTRTAFALMSVAYVGTSRLCEW
ncbi:hypothetical protein CBOM_07869 [Ceraceosorus bombacis]|uniref:Uncharacterized protein n=1 Tax=Ceraceosorus bombacis TaxID=401625 RepID=A0A0P1BQU5_9BASI|nr:hypothetical protein CBOM_07869 [Ceraceosorus bombacis]